MLIDATINRILFAALKFVMSANVKPDIGSAMKRARHASLQKKNIAPPHAHSYAATQR